MKTTNLNKGIILAVLFFMAFVLFTLAAFPIDNLIIVLNGVYAGSFVSIVTVYWRSLRVSVLEEQEFPYNEIRQMTLGFLLCWLAYSGSVWVSFYTRSMGLPIQGNALTAVSRMMAIIAAFLQVTALDYGQSWLYGRNRKILWLSATLGFMVAMIVVLMQNHQTLEKVL